MTPEEDGGGETTRQEAADSSRSEAATGTDREVGASSEGTAERTGSDPKGATARLDASAGAFLAIEDRLRPGAGPWRAVDVAVVPTDTVPESYPRSIGTAEALELRLESPAGGPPDSLYLPFPADGVVAPDSDLGRLLERCSIPADRFGDLHGQEIPVAREADALVLDLDADATERGSDRAISGLLGGYAVLLVASLLALLGVDLVVTSPLALVFLAIVNFVVLPIATYLDGWHLRSATGWSHAPGIWGILAIVPGVNLVTTALYLLSRTKALEGR